MDSLWIVLLDALGGGLLLFMLGSGLTLILGMMGVLNFAHASLYLLGAYLGHTLSAALGFGAALLLAPLAVGLLGAAFERGVLRRVRPQGHVAELLATFGLSVVLVEAVQLLWGRAPLPVQPPPWLQGAAFTQVDSVQHGVSWVLGAAPASLCEPWEQVRCARFPMARAFAMVVSLGMLALLALLLKRTRIGLVVQASLTHPAMVQALGHDLPRIQLAVFGTGCALAGLAGVIAGVMFVTEPSMALTVGSILFVVVVVGGLGSLGGAFVASLAVGLLQSLPVAVDASLADLLNRLGADVGPQSPGWALWRLSLAQAGPVLPYLLLVAVLVLRPRGLFGRRES